MSLMLCCQCDVLVDIDAIPEAFLVTWETVELPRHKQDHECVCVSCQDQMSDAELERRQPT